MNIVAKEYSVQYESGTSTVEFQGLIRLSGLEEYAPIVQLLNDAIGQNPSLIILDLRKLSLLNSSGINTLSRFIMRMRQQQDTKIVIKGSKTVSWHEKSMRNFQRLMPTLQVELDK